MQEIQAPHPYVLDRPSVFLAGSIEMGKAEHWQAHVKERLIDYNIILLNPRRDDWNASWSQHVNNPNFFEQVNWELSALEQADYILMNFVGGTISPISLLELGLFHQKKMFVCCPEAYWREGNVEIVCQRYKIPWFPTLDEGLAALVAALPSASLPRV